MMNPNDQIELMTREERVQYLNHVIEQEQYWLGLYSLRFVPKITIDVSTFEVTHEMPNEFLELERRAIERIQEIKGKLFPDETEE